jgi:transposase
MSRPAVLPAEDKIRIVLSVLAGELTMAEAARRNKVSETSIGRWKQQFLEAGRLGRAVGGSSRPSSLGRRRCKLRSRS